MPFAGICRMIRNLFFLALITAVILHRPAFLGLLRVLETIHIFLNIACNTAGKLVSTKYPLFAAWAIDYYHLVRAYLNKQALHYSRVLAPVVKHASGYIARCALSWINKSPRYLCKFNTWIANSGSHMANQFSNPRSLTTKQWLAVAEKAGEYCTMMQGWKADQPIGEGGSGLKSIWDWTMRSVTK